MKKPIIIVAIGFILSLFAYGYYANNNTSNIIYEKGFPQESSPALTDFMTDYFMQRSNFLFTTDEKEYVFAERNGSYDDENIAYFTFTQAEMEEFYSPLLDGDPSTSTMKELYHNVKDIQQPIESNLFLPTITCSDENTVTIVSEKKRRKVSTAQIG